MQQFVIVHAYLRCLLFSIFESEMQKNVVDFMDFLAVKFAGTDVI